MCGIISHFFNNDKHKHIKLLKKFPDHIIIINIIDNPCSQKMMGHFKIARNIFSSTIIVHLKKNILLRTTVTFLLSETRRKQNLIYLDCLLNQKPYSNIYSERHSIRKWNQCGGLRLKSNKIRVLTDIFKLWISAKKNFGKYFLCSFKRLWIGLRLYETRAEVFSCM